MKQWVCIFMLVTLASMHGIFEAAGSLSMIKTMQQPSQVTLNLEKNEPAICCEDETIELSTVAFHCPLDGKILTMGFETMPRSGKQIHFSCDTLLRASISSTAFFRPPIV
jgi:hypothetical protein